MSDTKPTKFNQAILALSESQSFFLSGIFIILFFCALYLTREIVVPLVIALLFNFLLSPAVRFLRRIYIPPQIGSAVVILVLFLVIGYGCYGLGRPATNWMTKGPEALEQVHDKLTTVAKFFATPIRALSQVNDEMNVLSENAQISGQHDAVTVQETSSYFMGTVATTTWQFLVEFGFTIILLYFLLIYDDFFLKKIVHWTTTQEKKKEVLHISRQVQDHIFKYLFARTIINLGLAIVVSVLMFIMDIADPILWGVVVGVLEFIPYFGALISLVIISAVAIVSFASMTMALLLVALFMIILFIEANVVTPIIIGRAVTLNPIIIFLSLLFWGWLWGIAGAFLAVPMMVTIKLIFETLYGVSFLNQLLSD
jgi:predicted PurR-regulated permease PerM